jgi:exodeoxyribonuclease VII large subunit
VVLKNYLQKGAHRLNLASTNLQAVSPLATLGRGYAIVMSQDGDILRDTKDLKPKQQLKTRLGHGTFTSTVDIVSND